MAISAVTRSAWPVKLSPMASTYLHKHQTNREEKSERIALVIIRTGCAGSGWHEPLQLLWIPFICARTTLVCSVLMRFFRDKCVRKEFIYSCMHVYNPYLVHIPTFVCFACIWLYFCFGLMVQLTGLITRNVLHCLPAWPDMEEHLLIGCKQSLSKTNRIYCCGYLIAQRHQMTNLIRA